VKAKPKGAVVNAWNGQLMGTGRYTIVFEKEMQSW